MIYDVIYEDKIEECTLLFRRVVSDFERELDKKKEKDRGKVAKGFFGPTFDGVRDDKDGIKRKALSLRKREGDNNLPKMYSLRETRV